MLTLPTELREELKEPFGPLYTDAETLLSEAGRPIIAVGDVVTYHLRTAGHEPHVAVVDGRTKRERVTEEVRAAVESTDGRRIELINEPAQLSRELLIELLDAVEHEENTLLLVEGEEDLATLPAVLAAPLDGTVVYGQPDEGMVAIPVTDETQSEMRDLLARFDGDATAALATLGY
ncbi:MAG: DUF359 domain-containing protein [Halolamina sp.]